MRRREREDDNERKRQETLSVASLSYTDGGVCLGHDLDANGIDICECDLLN